MKRCLITGIGGFIGRHTMDHFLLNTDWEIIGLDSFAHKGDLNRITGSPHYQRHKKRVAVFTHDLNTPISSELADYMGSVDYIVNLAAESHVDRSITDPVPFVQNNVNIALHMLEFARLAKPDVFIQISTDEVYGPAYLDAHWEWNPILPSNPYAASKAAQEAIAISYWRTYDVPVVLTNTMNNFGEGQDAEKFIPLAIKKILAWETIDIHASPDLQTPGSRYWLHARNHADALLYILKHGLRSRYPATEKPDRYNIVGDEEIDNLAMVKRIADILGLKPRYRLIDAHTSRPGHDLRYALHGDKLHALGWRPPVDFETSLKKTVQSYAL